MKRGKTTRALAQRGPAKLDLPEGYHEHSFCRTRDNGGVGIAAIDAGFGWSYSINQVPDFSEFAALYDAYTIDKVTMRFVLENNTAEEFPTLLFAPDYDDAANPATESVVLTHEQCKVLTFTANKRVHTVTVKPRVAVTLFRTGVTSSYGWAKEGMLVDIATTDTPFYGAKHWLVNYNTTDTPNARVRVFITYHIRCIGQR
jgi:hypothetical protein